MHRASRLAILIGLLAALAAACAKQSESTESERPRSCVTPHDQAETYRYRQLSDDELAVADVDENHVSLDVYSSPDAEGCPIVIWVHGGAWQAGDKLTLSTRETKARHFIETGHVFVSINYRLVSESNSIRWPVFGDDVAAATSWVIANAETFGGDSGRVSLIGHSSGAHLVSTVGTNPGFLEAHGHSPQDIACVISLDSVTHDLTDPPLWEADIIDLAFPTEAARVDGSPTLQAIEHANSSSPDFLIVTRGHRERVDSSNQLRDALAEAGANAEVVSAEPYSHRDVNIRLGIDGEEVLTPLVDEFLATCND